MRPAWSTWQVSGWPKLCSKILEREGGRGRGKERRGDEEKKGRGGEEESGVKRRGREGRKAGEGRGGGEGREEKEGRGEEKKRRASRTPLGIAKVYVSPAFLIRSLVVVARFVHSTSITVLRNHGRRMAPQC